MKALSLIILSSLGFFEGSGRCEKTNTLTLAQTYNETLASNFNILQQRKEVERAAGTKLEIRSADLAKLKVGISAGERNGQLYGNGGAYAYFTGDFSQPLFNTGIAARWRRGAGEVILAEQRLNLAVSERLQEVRLYYLRAQRLQQLIALYEEIETRLTNNLNSQQQRKETGATGPQFVLQAKVRLLAQRGELTALRREQSDMQIDWAALMQHSLEDLPQPADALKRESLNFEWKQLAQQALQRRADLRLLRQLIANAREDETVVQAGYYPQVSLIASGLYIPGKKRLYQTTQIIEGQVAYGSEVRGGVGATWQIVDNGRVTGVSREIRAVRQEYEVILRQLEENIPRELARLAHEMEDADAKLSALNQSANQADENLRLIESRISLGEATQLDFSDAQRNLLAVRRGIVDALFQHSAAVAQLDFVTGRYLEFADPPRSR